MPHLIFSASAIVNQITQLLRDRYPSGFPIIKELLQNADDAEARRFVVDFYESLPGSETATNPLLRAPGALILNDGRFSDTDMEGIRTFADSTKSHDSSRVGKFGIGQKAVFHLCDAFVVVADGYTRQVVLAGRESFRCHQRFARQRHGTLGSLATSGSSVASRSV